MAAYDRSDGFYRRQLVLTTKEKPVGRVDDPDLAEKRLLRKSRLVYGMGSCREGRLLLLADHVALIGTLAGENFVIEILLPVDIGHAVLQLPDRAA